MDEALKAYAALWDLLHNLATEERGLTDVEAEWLYTEQPNAVWNELRSRGLVPEGMRGYEPDVHPDLPELA